MFGIIWFVFWGLLSFRGLRGLYNIPSYGDFGGWVDCVAWGCMVADRQVSYFCGVVWVMMWVLTVWFGFVTLGFGAVVACVLMWVVSFVFVGRLGVGVA